MVADLPEPLLDQLSRCLDAELGLHFPKPRWPDLERGIQAAAKELGFETPVECAEWLMSSRLTKPQLELLAAHLTIGETYFFRDPAVFDFLGTQVLPELIRARRDTGRQIRIWSAACCTGEEPYTLAITLSRLLPDIADWNITILATDVNPRFLKKAVAGRYGNWSFRSAPDSVRAQYFHEVEEGICEIAVPIRKMVTFSALNLAEDAYPSLMTSTNAMDIIFCRNVLMYFSRENATKVAAKLHASLVDGGWLFTSATEVSKEVFPQFETVRHPGLLAFRKQGAARDDGPAFAPRPKPAPVRPVTAKPAAIESAPQGQPVQPGDLTLARRLANEGRLAEALAECEQAIAGDKLVAAGHYLRGVILQEKGALAGAREALRRALFLDHNLVVAHFALGNLMRQHGREVEATRSYENARALLQQYAPDAELPESGGITAGRLLAMVESIQDARV
ncbi:MAG: CheR family methyltransferase [Chthoniobacteraceae bacterium]